MKNSNEKTKIILKKMKTPVISGLIFILLGVLLWVLAKLFVGIIIFPIIIDFLKNMGQALMCLGTITMLVDFPDWKNYFGDRLKDIVIKRKYLETLNKDELASMQIDIYKSIYKHSDLEKEDSFLRYLQSDIQHLIDSSYREHVSANIKVEESGDDDIYTEKLSYTLRKVGGKIIDKIEWTWQEGELTHLDYNILLKCPNKTLNKQFCTCKDFDNCDKGFKRVAVEEFFKENKKDNSKGYIVPLKDFVLLHDGIQVLLELKYSVGKNRMATWSMVEPSKDVSINLTYPSKYNLDSFVGGLNRQEYILSENNDNTYYFFREGWMLPRAGVSFSFYDKQKTAPNKLS